MPRWREKDSAIIVYVGTHKLTALEAFFSGGEPKVGRWINREYPLGFESGFVTNLEQAASTLQTIIQELLPERTTEDIYVYVVLGNSKLKVYNFSSSQYYQGTPRMISSSEIKSVIQQTKSIATLPLTEYVLQALPESFLVNDTQGIFNPLGLEAYRLGVNLKMFTADFNDFKNIARAFELADIEAEVFYPKTLTLSEAVLSEREKDEGVVLIDIADDAVFFILWKNGTLAASKGVPLGGKDLTKKIAEVYNISIEDAEKVKERYGSMLVNVEYGDELIPIIEREAGNQQQIRRADFHARYLTIAEAWMETILKEVESFIAEQNVYYPNHVFTGGCAAMDGFLELMQNRFNQNARLGLPKNLQAPAELLADPSMSAVLGMVRWIDKQEGEYRKLLAPQGIFEKTMATARDWFLAYF